jgi:hypothetical protein
MRTISKEVAKRFMKSHSGETIIRGRKMYYNGLLIAEIE